MGWSDWRELGQISEQISDLPDVQGRLSVYFSSNFIWVT